MTKGNWPALSLAEVEARLTAPGQRFEMEELVIRGIRTRVWKNAPPTTRDIFNMGRSFGSREFLVYEDDRASYEDFARASLAIAYALKALGVGKGDRVAIVMRNLPEFVPAYHGILLLGAIATPLNAWWTGQELEYGLTDSGSKVAIVDSERLGRIASCLDRCPDLEHVFVARHDSAMPHVMVGPLEDVIGKVDDWKTLPDRPLPDVDIHPDDDASILYTSGTTGRSKGALCTHRNIACNILAGAFATARNFLRRGEEVPVVDPKTAPQRSSLISIPMFHATALFSRLGPLMMVGGKLVFMHRWDVVKALGIIEREKINQIGGVPTIPWQLLEHPDFDKYDTSSIDQCSYGGAPAAPELVRRIKKAWPKCEPGFGWGMTETAATVTTHIAEEYEHKPESCGPAIGVCDIKILDANGKELPAGEMGEIWCTGPNIARCYWNNPEASAQTFVDNWVRTGDIGRLDEEGFLYIMDRAKDMVLRGGENIYSIEVENALYEHPAVMDAAIVPIPHKILGEEPGAVVHLKPGATASEDELRAFVRERLAAFKTPVKIVFWSETLPRNANGKILKTELKKLFIPAEA